MSKVQEFADKFFNKPPQPQLYEAEVVSVEGATCTVKLVESSMEVQEVRLAANDSTGLIIKPKVGSRVIVGVIELEVSTLFVVQYSEVDFFQFKIENTEVVFDNTGVAIEQQGSSVYVQKNKTELITGQMEITLENGKVSIKNAGVNMKDLFGDLVTLLNSFSVITPVGPSAGLNPATTALLVQLQTKINLLLA